MPRSRLPALVAALAATAVVTLTAAPADAHGDRNRIKAERALLSADTNTPLIASDNVSLVSSNPGSAGISGCCEKTAPLFVQSSLDSVTVYDVSTPPRPVRKGTMPSAHLENEAMNCGQRTLPDGSVRRSAMIGVDTYRPRPATSSTPTSAAASWSWST